MPTTRIEFAHETINPLVGCSRITPGCINCYAVPMAHRLGSNPATPQYAGATHMTPHGLDWTGEVRWVPGVMEKAKARLLKARKRRRIFMVSMGDLFHDRVLGLGQFEVFRFMRDLPMHNFIVITKRADEMESFVLPFVPKPLPNVILMATVEDRPRLDERAPHLRRLAALGWYTGLIFEPLLEGVNLEPHLYYNDPSDDGARARNNWNPWVVIGHEQGPGARILSTSTSGALIAQACRAGLPVFFKKDSHGLRGDPDRQPRQFPEWMLVEGEA